MFCRARLYQKVHNFYLEFIHLSGVLLTPGSEHRSQAGERRGVLLQQAELIPELDHGLAHDGLLSVVLGLQVGQSNLGCLLVGLEDSSEGGDLLPLGGEERLQLD